MQELYADILVDTAGGRLDRSFQYAVPPELRDTIREGQKVLVPFGSGKRTVEGYVLSLGSDPKIDRARMKTIERCCENSVTVEDRLVTLAAWMRKVYGSSMLQALKTVLPVKEKKKVLQNRTIRLNIPESEARDLAALFEKKHYKAKYRLISILLQNQSLPWRDVVKEANIPPALIRDFEKAGYLCIESTNAYRIPENGTLPEMPEADTPLTEEQTACLNAIQDEWQSKNPRPCLIKGVTGSGKTLIYMKLIRQVLAEGRQAILLIPEISLTWQTFGRFYRVFGDRAALLHSRLSQGERSDLLERIDSGEVSLVIGPRSALFTPFSNLGLIIMDEEHDDSYKSEMVPRYHARETAIARARIEGAFVVMGSATPSMEARAACERGHYRMAELTKRYGRAGMPEMEIVDMRAELKEGNSSLISSVLEEAIEDRLQKKEQIMLFLNRRGYAGHFMCRSCGTVIKCPHCDVALTLHKNGRLKCHYCGFEKPMMQTCPVCGSPHIGGFSAGTQQAEELLANRFPQAGILRMDRDSTSGRHDFERLLSGFARREADILIGTQMIAKGHDFPGVTLVGILSADSSLYAGDYRASERTFELLTQTAGRAGRGNSAGRVLIQTYNPDHFVINAVVSQDYERFYRAEADARALCGYPPFGYLLSIHVTCKDEERLAVSMRNIRIYAESIGGKNTIVLGPAPDEIYKIRDTFRMVLYIKERNFAALVRQRQLIERYIEINPGFDPVSVQFDLNA